MDKILCIVRASTDRQEVDSQRKELVEYIKSYGWTDSQVVVLESTGASARKKNAKYLQFLEDIKSTIKVDPDIKAVGMWSLDRLGRVDDSLIEMKNWFIKEHIQVICKSPAFILLNQDGTTNQGAEIAYGVFAALVKQQTEDIFLKFKRGKARNKAQGKFNGGPWIKYGYQKDTTGKLVVCPAEAKVIQDIFTMYSVGNISTYQLTEDLRSRGVLLREREVNLCRITRVLKDKSLVPDIIDQELLDKVESIRKNISKPKITKNTSLLGPGLFKCPECGYHMFYDSGYYRCTANKRKTHSTIAGYPVCSNSRRISGHVIESILHDFRDFWINTYWKENLHKENLLKIKVLEQKSSEISRRITLQSSKRHRLQDLYISLEISEGVYRKKSAEILEETIRLQSTLGEYAKEIEFLESGETQSLPDLKTIVKSTKISYSGKDTIIEIQGYLGEPMRYLIKYYCRKFVKMQS